MNTLTNNNISKHQSGNPIQRTTETQSVWNIDFLSDQVAAQLCDDSSFVEELTSRIFAQTIQFHLARLDHASSNPFDSVYLSALEPDIVNQATISSLESFKGIEDQSSSLNLPED
jgi:hypothetical protein